jgi:hypothetical protein
MDIVYESYLSGFPKKSVLDGLVTYKKIWSYDNLITEADFNRLVDIMKGRQNTEEELKKTPYSTAVDMSFVREARGLS